MLVESLTADEKQEIETHGLLLDDVEQQLRAYADPPAFARLVRPCTRGDGILALGSDELERLGEVFDRRARASEVVKFVPASGAASRMFQAPLSHLYSDAPVARAALTAETAARSAAETLALLDGLEDFAFFEELRARMADQGLDLLREATSADVRVVLEFLLTARGLDYAARPKALLAFHRYDEGARTAFEEHLVEAAVYARGRGDICRLHFTVSPEHREAFELLLARIREGYEQRFGVAYEVAFSVQKPSTDALAVDPDGRPFKERDGGLLFRPGGHGALIENLASIDADVVFIKNIDNVVPDHAKGPTYAWKRALGGLALELRAGVEAHLQALDKRCDGATVAAALQFLERSLGTSAPATVTDGDTAVRAAFARRMLDRPLRVCGMVENTGEPGGGPFWVDWAGRNSVQIVETSQVDSTDSEQKGQLARATHFNPVDLVCVYRRADGSLYDLRDYVDREAVFIAEKSKDGRPLRSLERPGLWNGAMADWNTIFVEVPIATFAPVKTVAVLLDDAHQPPHRHL
jgi:hypothetical protein